MGRGLPTLSTYGCGALLTLSLGLVPGPQGGCPVGYWEIAANGRSTQNWGCCSGCPGGTSKCYGDCACKCSSASSCADIIIKEDGSNSRKAGNCAAAHACTGGDPCYAGASADLSLQCLFNCASPTPPLSHPFASSGGKKHRPVFAQPRKTTESKQPQHRLLQRVVEAEDPLPQQ